MPRPSLSPVAEALRVSWRADPWGTVVGGVMQLAGVLGALVVVLATKIALDSLLGGGGEMDSGLVGALVLVAVASAATGALGVLSAQHQRLQGERVSQFLWRELLQTCAAVDLSTWESTSFMDRLDRIRSNALGRPALVMSSLFSLAGGVMGAAALVVALGAIEPLLVPVLLLAGVPAVAVARLASRSEFAFSTASNAVLRRRVYLKQLVTGRAYAAELRAFESADRLLARHDAEDADFLVRLRRQVRRRQSLGLLTTGTSALALAGTLVLIVVLVDAGRISLAEAGAAAIAARLLAGQLATAFGAIGGLIESGPFLADMQSFLADRPTPRPPAHARDLTSQLRLDDVYFEYPGAPRPAVAGVSIVIPRGSVVALVGENGSGKTTLAKVVGGLFETTKGQITWDGDAMVTAADLRASSSLLFQDFVRYQMSGEDNITIARPTVPEPAAAVEAARRAGIHETLAALPEGYDTVLGMELSEGSDLSGGQWQRLALARAFYRDRSLIVLDEPTAALDARAEHELFADVRAVLDGRSALLISHRYSSVRLADYIYVLDRGRVVEEGTHASLVQLGGRYAELYALQRAGFAEDQQPV